MGVTVDTIFLLELSSCCAFRFRGVGMRWMDG